MTSRRQTACMLINVNDPCNTEIMALTERPVNARHHADDRLNYTVATAPAIKWIVAEC